MLFGVILDELLHLGVMPGVVKITIDDIGIAVDLDLFEGFKKPAKLQENQLIARNFSSVTQWILLFQF